MKNKVDYYEYYDDYDDFEITETFNESEKLIKEKTPLSHCLWAKIIAFIMVVVMCSICVFSTLSAVIFIDRSSYSTTKDSFVKDAFYEYAYSTVDKVIYDVYYDFYYEETIDNFDDFCIDKGLSKLEIREEKNNTVVYNFKNSTKPLYEFNFDTEVWRDEITVLLNISVAVDENCLNNNMSLKFINNFYEFRYWVYAVILLSFVIALSSFIFLVCSVGHHKGEKEIKGRLSAKIPLDLFFAITVAIIVALVYIVDSTFMGKEFGSLEFLLSVIILAACVVAGITVVLAFILNLVLKIKLRDYKTNIIYFVGVFIFKAFKSIGKLIVFLFDKIHIIFKSLITIIISFIVGIIAIAEFNYDTEILVVGWIIFTVLLTAVTLYCVIAFDKLKIASDKIANGDMNYQIETKNLIFEFKTQGDNLNSISKGISIAVDEKLKSERLKTELITNVSHDIKTPLTSIINYTDLLGKEEFNNDKAYEYIEVLTRQSSKLKKLIDDLVEASKASTGNLEVSLVPSVANILITQIAGEYDEKLKERNLQLVVNQTDLPLTIMADGKRLWRVFDNLFNNICKYAQSNTRVYLSLEKVGDNAEIVFKNTSSAPLNITADELLERFVRGDGSRATEGNGLGLSIAKSLTELQNGKMELFVDGDLFKVILKFPII